MIIKEGELICIASGVFEVYDKAGPFIVVRDFDLDAFIETITPSAPEPWEMEDLMRSLPRVLLENGFITKMPCRMVYLGAWGEFDIREEKHDI
ncbi:MULTISPECIES: hypothetical protein [Pseudomonas syringae group]|uniref:Uncharacterized protein n=3 Tax=Pseudomonas syringae group TaxID=136849 RepID=A0A3M6GSF9_PSEAJ|nr:MULTISPECIES: hypothetical protein [Pseudomonas syringae group]MEE4665848.1 hypothetical protein [Pseudomonas alliivorans]KOP53236.1 hypothetical protein OX88_21505 [Pseudomonas coronafaciens pv. porri]KOP60631.1 hypothetical protein OX90_04960 [Pseudomonas coronafaciens pv. porri]KPY21591.1 Uncharacterized protein ALO89_01191 [Pseudomonas coronafaciens pv. porri]MBI6851104.1 hypothetical protein [Pseudomonas syringae]